MASKVWLQKAHYMSYEVLFITKSGVSLDIPLYNSWTTLVTLYITYDCLYSTNDTWNFTLHHLYKNDTFSAYTHVGKKWLVSPRRHNTKTRMVVERLDHQLPLHDAWRQTDAMLDSAQWCLCTL